MTEVLHRSIPEQIRAVNDEKRRITFIISTYDLDSYNTRIDQTGWDFSDFAKNAVVCLQHDSAGYTQSAGLPIAKGIIDSIQVKNQQTFMDVEFPKEGDFPLADTVYKLAKNGFVNAGSVGFDPIEHEDVNEVDEEGKQMNVRIYRRQKLLEFSIVTLPANSNALIQRAKKLNADVDEIVSIAKDLDRLTMESKSKPDPEYIEKCISYFETKQKANKASTKVLKSFYAKVIKADPPADEVEAWERMGLTVESLEGKPEEKVEEKPVEEIKAEPVEKPVEEVKEEPTKPNPVIEEAPQSARKASVQIPVEELLLYPERFTKALTDVAVEALRRGIPMKDMDKLIDGLQETVSSSLSQSHNGSDQSRDHAPA